MLESIFSLEILSFLIAILVALTVHEFAHACVANYLGDPTAKYAGRLSLNPTSHLDLYGSMILIISLIASIYARFPFIFGWGKPVPVNPYNLKHRHGELIVSLAGPISNFLVAIFLVAIIAILPAGNKAGLDFASIASVINGAGGYEGLAILAASIISVNVALGIFNLLPIPPLDGSRILLIIFPPGRSGVGEILQKYGLFILIFIFLFGLNFLRFIALLIISSLLYLGFTINSLIY